MSKIHEKRSVLKFVVNTSSISELLLDNLVDSVIVGK